MKQQKIDKSVYQKHVSAREILATLEGEEIRVYDLGVETELGVVYVKDGKVYADGKRLYLNRNQISDLLSDAVRGI